MSNPAAAATIEMSPVQVMLGDHERRIVALEETERPLCAVHSSRIEALEHVQERILNTVERLMDKLDTIRNLMIGTLATAVVSLLGWIIVHLLGKQ